MQRPEHLSIYQWDTMTDDERMAELAQSHQPSIALAPAKRGRPKLGPRYKAQIRKDGRVIHIGYYSSQEERDVVVGLARLGVFP